LIDSDGTPWVESLASIIRRVLSASLLEED
jgi:hypothetical protein